MTDYNDIYEGNYSEDDFDDFDDLPCGGDYPEHDYRIVLSSDGVNCLYCSRCGAESVEYYG